MNASRKGIHIQFFVKLTKYSSRFWNKCVTESVCLSINLNTALRGSEKLCVCSFASEPVDCSHESVVGS